MKRMDSKGEVEVIGFDDVSNAEDHRNDKSLEASTGPYLFVQEGSWNARCGAAHQNHSDQLLVFRLGSNARSRILTKGDIAQLRQRVLTLDGSNLLKCVEGNRATMDPPGPTTLDGYDLDSAVPRWTLKDGLRFQLVFAIWPNFVTGERRCETDVDRAPDTLSTFPPPAGLLALARQLPDFDVRGWSVLPLKDVARAPTITRAFGTDQAGDASKSE